MAPLKGSRAGDRVETTRAPEHREDLTLRATPLPRTLASLTSLRAFAALAVFLFHLDMFGVLRLPGATLGYSGVGFFFILSGFVLAWTAPSRIAVRDFYRRRIARIYPSHLAVVLVVVVTTLVVGGGVSLLALASSVLLVQAWWPAQEIAFGINGAAWSLSCEAAFYAAFPVLVRALRAAPLSLRFTAPALWLATTLVIAVAAPETNRILYHLPVARMAEFVLGIAVAVTIQQGWRPRLRLGSALALTGLVTLGLALAAPETTVVGVALAVPFTAVIVAAAMSDIAGRSGALGVRVLIYAGEVSFAFYLVHQLVLAHVDGIAPSGPTAAGISLIASAGLAALLHHLVERPMQRLISRGSGHRAGDVPRPSRERPNTGQRRLQEPRPLPDA